VILGVAEADAAALIEHPDSLAALIQSGSVFTVPNETAVAISSRNDRLIQVHVLSGVFQGRDGWVRADQVVGR
jgi:hypothetical protein